MSRQSRGVLGHPKILPGYPHRHIKLKVLCIVLVQDSYFSQSCTCHFSTLLCSKCYLAKTLNFQIRIAELAAELNEVTRQRDTLDDKFLSLLAVNEKLENKVSQIDCMQDDITKVKQEASKWKSKLFSHGAELSTLRVKTEVLSRENNELKEEVEAQKVEVSAVSML